MEKDNIYTEEQEKELIERINEIKNQTKKENNNNVQINEQPIENNNTAGIENVIVYQDNAKKTMKGKKGILFITTGITIFTIIGLLLSSETSKFKEKSMADMYLDSINNYYQVDNNHQLYHTNKGEHYTIIEIEINPNDYDSSNFDTIDLYYKLYNDAVKKAWEDGYDPYVSDDVFCIYDCLKLEEISDLNFDNFFDRSKGQMYYPKNGKYYYVGNNNVSLLRLVEVNLDTGTYVKDSYNYGISEYYIEKPKNK